MSKKKKSEIEKYVSLVTFLSQTIGPNVILSLIDMSEGFTKILSMQYGRVDHAETKAKVYEVVDYALENKLYEKHDFTSDKLTVKSNDTYLRTSIYFFKNDNNELIGMLIMFIDDTKYKLLAEEILKLAHSDKYVEQRYEFNESLMNNQEIIETGSEIEITTTIDDIISEEINKELIKLNKPVDSLNKNEKVGIVKNLDEKGIFIMKGSVEILSEKLEVSQPTIYRYITEVRS